MATDNDSSARPGLIGPCENLALVTPSDGADLSNTTRAIFVGGAGNLKVTTKGGQTVTLSGVAAGSVLPIRVERIFATDTTATNIAALW